MAKQNEVWKGVESGVDLNPKIPQIIDEVSKKTGFAPTEVLSKSSWWTESTGVGAFHLSGTFDGRPAVLKVQGVKPETSEVEMINAFAKQNKSKVVRPPLIYANFPYDDQKGYEAFILEDVGTNLVAAPPTTPQAVDEFFKYFKEYRRNCRNTPWLEKTDVSLADVVKSRFDKWIAASHKIFPDHPFREPDDEALVHKAVSILTANPKWLELEFVHGHFSARDMFRVGKDIVLLSNLYWSWRTPYYDLIFAYHWFMYDLANVKDISEAKIEAQRSIWLERIKAIAKDQTLLKYAFLERAAAGLNLDALSVDTKKPMAKHMVEQTRKITKQLLEELS